MNIRRTGIAATIAALALALAACSGPNKPLTANGDAPATSPASSTDSGKEADGPEVGLNDDKSGIDWCANVKVSSFAKTGPYSAEEVADAYCELITFNGESGFTSLAVADPDGYSVGDLAFIKDSLTPAAYATASELFEQGIKDLKSGKGDDSQALRSLGMLTAVAQNGNGYTFPDPDRLTDERTWSPADFSINSEKDKESGADRLYFKMKFTDTLILKKGDGKPFTVDRTRDMEIAMSPSGENAKNPHTWRVDGWNGKETYGSEKPYSAKS